MSTYFHDSWLAKKNPIEYVKDKRQSSKSYINYMMIRLQQMFKYENLPETIPKEMLEYYLMNNGSCFVAKVKGELYAFTGSFGGEPDAYYRPTKYVVANPALKLSEEFDINKDGVLMRSDSLWCGLYPMMARYASLLAENLLTIRSADVMLRVVALLTAPDDRTKVAAENYLKKLENGEFGVIGEKRFMDEGIKMQSPPSNNGSYLTQFIELHQYLKGSFFNEVGLNANFNMKREALGDGETSMNEDILLPLCDEMLQCRQEDIEKINKMFGTDIKVDFSSAWKQNVEELELQMAQMEVASQLAESDEGTEDGEEEENGNSSQTDETSDESDGETPAGDGDTSSDDDSGECTGSDNESEEHSDGEDSSDAASATGIEIDIDVNVNTSEEEEETSEEDDTSEEEETAEEEEDEEKDDGSDTTS